MPTDAKKQSMSTWRTQEGTRSGATLDDSGRTDTAQETQRLNRGFYSPIMYTQSHSNKTLKLYHTSNQKFDIHTIQQLVKVIK